MDIQRSGRRHSLHHCTRRHRTRVGFGFGSRPQVRDIVLLGALPRYISTWPTPVVLHEPLRKSNEKDDLPSAAAEESLKSSQCRGTISATTGCSSPQAT